MRQVYNHVLMGFAPAKPSTKFAASRQATDLPFLSGLYKQLLVVKLLSVFQR